MGPPLSPVTTPCTPTLGPVPATQPTAALEGSVPPQCPSPDPFTFYVKAQLSAWKTDFMPELGQAVLQAQNIPILLSIYFSNGCVRPTLQTLG